MSKPIKDERYWNRKHSKNTKQFIECTYWACKHHAVMFRHLEKAAHSCAAMNYSLDYWWGSNAPNWCPKRNHTIPLDKSW